MNEDILLAQVQVWWTLSKQVAGSNHEMDTSRGNYEITAGTSDSALELKFNGSSHKWKTSARDIIGLDHGQSQPCKGKQKIRVNREIGKW